MPQLTVNDGFRFGCGFFLAALAFYFAVVIVLALGVLLALLFNVNIPLGGRVAGA
ncbi:MAG TPA: hypothetical protein VGL23_16130 [Chloroflexota bacterium]